ncbi:MAG: AraC family transcriptional regulator [Hyphomonas sp.]|nr:AraC family transcriptional regulator [Hyphomonas sp.]
MQLVLKTPDAAASNVQAGQSEVGKRSAWDLRAVTMQEWIDLWAPILSINLLHPRRPEDGTNMLQSRARGGLVGARFATGCELFRHGYAQRDVSGGVVSVQRLHSGFAALEFSNSNYVHRPGTITITDFKQRFRGSHHNAEIEQVMIPRSELGLTDADPVAPIVIDVDSQRGRQIALQLERYFARSGDEAFEPENLITLIKSEIQESWTPVSDREEWWIGRRNLIRKYIDTHLEDPNLGPRQICELFNMSRATLYRMFELDGGVRRRIQDRRLFSAIWDLATGGIRRGRLSQVSERWGFSSDANFNRAVKLAFGRPPGSLFKTGYRADMNGEARRPVNDPMLDWFSVEQKGVLESYIAGS